MTRLEWAFAGRSRTEAAKAGPGEQKPAHTVWDHWVDSNSDDPAIDEGDLWPQPNGDVLEQGTTVERGTGVVTAYEELWKGLKMEVVGQEEAFVSIVLRVQDDRMGARGMVVRVGGWCQGILKVGNNVTIERWQWKSSTSRLSRDAAQDETDGNQPATTQQLSTALEDPFRIEDLRRGDWERVVRLGSHFVPCAVTFNPALIERHGVVEMGDAKWEVIENYHWSARCENASI